MNILLVSDDNVFAKTLKEKLVFLRQNDEVTVVDYENVNIKGVNVILVHQNNSFEKTVNLINVLRADKELSIIFVANPNDNEAVLSVVDLGVDDFIWADAKDFEFVIRIINNLKRNSIKLVVKRNEKLLEQVRVIDEFSGLYKQEYCSSVLRSFRHGTFVALTPCDKVAFSVENIAEIFRTELRAGDIAFWGKGANLYVFLPETDFNGAVSVFNKINLQVEIRAGFANISNPEYEKAALNAMAGAADGEYAYDEVKENTLDDWLSDTLTGNYKLFRKVFNNKMEKVIAPIFYRLQKSYENKLSDTEIVQYTNSEQCVFGLKNDKGESSLRIIYSGFARVLVSIEHEGLDSPENREISLQLDKVTQKELIRIVEEFIEEFGSAKC